MAIDRKLWRPRFQFLPAWPCPRCAVGTLKTLADTFHTLETGPSKRAHEDVDWGRDWTEERFAGIMKCQNAECGDLVCVAGDALTVESFDYEYGPEYFTYFVPTSVHPPPPIFPIASECPSAVSAHIKTAFQLFWVDVGSAANRLRSAVEAILTERKIPKTRLLPKRKKKIRLSTHERIEIFKLKNPDAAVNLLAIKWIGNSGSHEFGDSYRLDRDILLDGIEILEFALEQIYVRNDKRIRKLASEINTRKGRRSSTSRKRPPTV